MRTETSIRGIFKLFNPRLGDPIRLIQNKAIIDEIESKDLLKLVTSTGSYLFDILSKFQSGKAKGIISNLRGSGTFLAFDCNSSKSRDDLVILMRKKGVVLGGSGEKTIRFRPMLVLEKKDVDIFAAIFGEVIATIS
jgi:4-aminobutyrate aminotransferase/(S)-3-amino-2-methylpropionate transaminase